MTIQNPPLKVYFSLKEFYSDLKKNHFTFQTSEINDPFLVRRAHHYLKIFKIKELATHYFIRQLLMPFGRIIKTNFPCRLEGNVLHLTATSPNQSFTFDDSKKFFFTSISELTWILQNFGKKLSFDSSQTVVLLDCPDLPKNPLQSLLRHADPKDWLEITPKEIEYQIFHHEKHPKVRGIGLSDHKGISFSLKKVSLAGFLLGLILHSSKKFISEMQKGLPQSFLFLHVKAFVYIFLTQQKDFLEYQIDPNHKIDQINANKTNKVFSDIKDKIRENILFKDIVCKILFEFSADEWDTFDVNTLTDPDVRSFVQCVKGLSYKNFDSNILDQLKVVYEYL